ncbi:hypothetical protein ACVBE9_10540 [Eionea flava]
MASADGSSGGSGKPPGKSSGFGFSQSVRNVFSAIGGKVSGAKKSQGIQRAETMVAAPPIEQRRATLTDASTVANAFQSGDMSRIQDVMKKHEVRANLGGDASSGHYTFGVTDFGISRDRRDSQGALREMKTFIVAPTQNTDIPHFEAGYNAMTPRETGWSGNGGQETLNTSSITMTKQQDPVQLTPRLTGCSLVEDAFGRDGHVQPFQSRKDVPETSAQATMRATTHLKAHKDISDVFGPEEYGRQGRDDHVASNAVVFSDASSGNKTVLHQNIYRVGSGDTRITTGQQAFGRRYQMGTIPPSQPGSMRRPTTAPPTTNANTLQVPQSPIMGSHREPRP